MGRTGRIGMDAAARVVRHMSLLAAVGLVACATPPSAPPPAPAAPAPAREIADLGALRRCVGDLLVDYGTRDLSLAIEPLAEGGRRDDEGARDALAADIGEMAQRSRAIRVVAAEREPQVPGPGTLLLRGSLRRTARALSLDLNAFSARDQGAVAGTASSRTVALADAGAELRLFGAVVRAAPDGGAGDRRSLRLLVDVSAVELVGRLARVPYWTCFGAAPDDPGVAAETQNWYDAMAAHPAEIIGYFQQQLRQRRQYDGAVDGSVNAPFKDAVARYREALGLPREPKLTLEFFRAYLAADHRALAQKTAPASLPAVASAVAPAAVAAPVAEWPAHGLELRLQAPGRPLARGEALQFDVLPSRDAFVYCFHQDEQRRIRRFFPNRFQSEARVSAAGGLHLPGDMRFEIAMNARGTPETVTCFATESDVWARLPARLALPDFAPLPLTTLEQLRSAFADAARGAVAQDSFVMRAR